MSKLGEIVPNMCRFEAKTVSPLMGTKGDTPGDGWIPTVKQVWHRPRITPKKSLVLEGRVIQILDSSADSVIGFPVTRPSDGINRSRFGTWLNRHSVGWRRRGRNVRFSPGKRGDRGWSQESVEPMWKIRGFKPVGQQVQFKAREAGTG